MWDATLETKHSKNFSETLVRLNAEEKDQLKRDFLRQHSAYLKSEVWKNCVKKFSAVPTTFARVAERLRQPKCIT